LRRGSVVKYLARRLVPAHKYANETYEEEARCVR
jgi:hypothetical protein